MKALPLVLLGIRTNVKPDINCTSAELVYGMTLRLSGEFFHCSDDQQLDPIPMLTIMQQLQPPAVRSHHQNSPYMSSDLDSCTHVFVRHDAVKTPLQQPYDGPLKSLNVPTNILHWTSKEKNRLFALTA